MEYYVDDIRKPFEEIKKIEANSPIEAVKKAFPNCKVERDYTNMGEIVVGSYIQTYNSRSYRTYVYKIGESQKVVI